MESLKTLIDQQHKNYNLLVTTYANLSKLAADKRGPKSVGRYYTQGRAAWQEFRELHEKIITHGSTVPVQYMPIRAQAANTFYQIHDRVKGWLPNTIPEEDWDATQFDLRLDKTKQPGVNTEPMLISYGDPPDTNPANDSNVTNQWETDGQTEDDGATGGGNWDNPATQQNPPIPSSSLAAPATTTQRVPTPIMPHAVPTMIPTIIQQTLLPAFGAPVVAPTVRRLAPRKVATNHESQRRSHTQRATGTKSVVRHDGRSRKLDQCQQ